MESLRDIIDKLDLFESNVKKENSEFKKYLETNRKKHSHKIIITPNYKK